MQYVYGVAFVRLGDIAQVNRGVRVVRNNLDENGEYFVYQNSLTPLGKYNSYNCTGGMPFVISAGAAGGIGYSENKFWAADDCLIFEITDCITYRYLYFVLLNNQDYINSQVRKASVPRLSRSVIENMIIPLPPIEEQNRIVGILDRFDKLCNDISEGLPAEIEARQKQYEYYRDKLLNFNS